MWSISGTRSSTYLSLVVSSIAISLIQEGELYKLVYYISKVFYDVETKYSKLKKMVYTLVISARKLCPYFQAHVVAVIIDQPMKTLFY